MLAAVETTGSRQVAFRGRYRPFEDGSGALSRDVEFIMKAFINPVENILKYFEREYGGVKGKEVTVFYTPKIFTKEGFPKKLNGRENYLRKRLVWRKIRNRLFYIIASSWLDVVEYLGYVFPCTKYVKECFPPFYNALQSRIEPKDKLQPFLTDLDVVAEVRILPVSECPFGNGYFRN